jgi:hypothetical protein
MGNNNNKTGVLLPMQKALPFTWKSIILRQKEEEIMKNQMIYFTMQKILPNLHKKNPLRKENLQNPFKIL